jgi:ATP-dependent Clp protease protease subunit
MKFIIKNKKNIYNEPTQPSTVDSFTNIEETDYDINSPEYLFKQIDYGFNLDNEIIYLHGEIKGQETLYSIMQSVNIIMRYREQEREKEPISISINSTGGDVFEMFAIIDYIQTLSVPVNIVCRGQACSAAAWILTMGTGVRAMSKHSTLMLHEGFYSIEDKFHSVKSSLSYFDFLEDVGYKMLEEKTGTPASFWKEKCRVDWYLTPDEALNLKLIDKII